MQIVLAADTGSTDSSRGDSICEHSFCGGQQSRTRSYCGQQSSQILPVATVVAMIPLEATAIAKMILVVFRVVYLAICLAAHSIGKRCFRGNLNPGWPEKIFILGFTTHF